MNNYTEDIARENCKREMNTTAIQLCKSLPGFDIEPYLLNCVDDAMVSTLHVQSIRLISYSRHKITTN